MVEYESDDSGDAGQMNPEFMQQMMRNMEQM